jgi:hypothetical protein
MPKQANLFRCVHTQIFSGLAGVVTISACCLLSVFKRRRNRTKCVACLRCCCRCCTCGKCRGNRQRSPSSDSDRNSATSSDDSSDDEKRKRKKRRNKRETRARAASSQTSNGRSKSGSPTRRGVTQDSPDSEGEYKPRRPRDQEANHREPARTSARLSARLMELLVQAMRRPSLVQQLAGQQPPSQSTPEFTTVNVLQAASRRTDMEQRGSKEERKAAQEIELGSVSGKRVSSWRLKTAKR